MSDIVTPASARAASTASDARSTTSLSGYLPNFVMWIPRIQMSSLALMVSSFLRWSHHVCDKKSENRVSDFLSQTWMYGLLGGRVGWKWWVAGQAGSKPKPMASTPLSSAPSE